ncbi:MAG: TetR/AcrR family transcriptional regulator [Clostridiaceae bacterium]|nr:TetR/AcrR family transcriptional regulator [Clostridiaceae bacterium]
MKKEVQSSRKLKAANTKKKIYETARQLILEQGYENVSVDSIVEAAGVAKGSFYVHFESKDALVVDVIEEITKMADLNYKSFLTTVPDGSSTLDMLLLLAGKISDFIEFNISLDNMKVLYKTHLTKAVDTTSATSYNRELYTLFSRVLEMGVEQGELREDMPVASLSKHLILAIRGITFEWCIRHPDFDLKEQVLEHFRILLYGLRNPSVSE